MFARSKEKHNKILRYIFFFEMIENNVVSMPDLLWHHRYTKLKVQEKEEHLKGQ